MTPTVRDAVVRKINQKRITNSKDLRKLRTILRDPAAKAHFLTEDGDVDSAMLRLGPSEPKRRSGLVAELDSAMDVIKATPWTAIEELRGDDTVLRKLDEAELLLRTLREKLVD